MDYIKCKKCGQLIKADTHYLLTTCHCGAISVDGGKEYTRILGDKKDWEFVNKKEA